MASQHKAVKKRSRTAGRSWDSNQFFPQIWGELKVKSGENPPRFFRGSSRRGLELLHGISEYLRIMVWRSLDRLSASLILAANNLEWSWESVSNASTVNVHSISRQIWRVARGFVPIAMGDFVSRSNQLLTRHRMILSRWNQILWLPTRSKARFQPAACSGFVHRAAGDMALPT